MISTSELLGFSMLSQLAELRNAWEQDYSERAQGGFLALSGFEYQFLLTLLKIVHLWKKSTDAERQDLETAQKILAEAISDITESGRNITFTQVKRTLSASNLRSALEELWEIFNLASEKTPDLGERLQFVISGQFEGHGNPQGVIQGWRTQSEGYPQQKLRLFKERVRYELIPDPRSELSIELQILARDENTDETIARWLGYLLQLGSGFSPESISAFIWRELTHDKSLEAFGVTLKRLFDQSQRRLYAIRETLGDRIILPRAKLSELRASVLEKNVTLLLGPSGSGKSALCKVGIQQDFKQNFDCLFLHASDIASFTESSDVIANRGLRRLDELLIARITQKPTLIVIDDLSDVDDQHFDAVLNLLHNTLITNTSSDVRFVLVAHVDARHRINEKISTRFGNNFVSASVELPQLPIEELKRSEDLPASIANLVGRHREFGPALNLKLIDWLVSSVQREQIDIPIFRNDLDLLTWFWCSHVQNGQDFSDLGQALIKIAGELANRFTPDLPCYFDSSIGNEVLRTLVRRDCLRIVDERLTTTHRFVGDCARFYYLRGNRREIESEHLVEWLQNPFWVQPIRWFALQLALESSKGETWQEFLCEALAGEHLQLLDLLLDGAILSKQPNSVLQMCPDKSLPFVVERLITRLLTIATEQYPFHADGSQSTSLRTLITIQEQITGIPKPDLWEPIWHWLLSQNPETVIEESCIVFRAAEAWLNWSVYAERFLLRSEVAEFTLDLAQRVLLPDPDPEARVINSSDLAELIKLRQQEVRPKPEPIRKRSYYLGDFKSNVFSCIVFALRIIPERSTWFLRVLAGREITPANKLEPTEISPFLSRSGVGILETPHSQGPLGRVNQQFRTFMLKQGGLYLTCVIRVDPLLGNELLLALTIEPPRYHYEFDNSYDGLKKDYGTAGSDSIDVCTFKFSPLLTLLEINEEIAINIINTLCQIATSHNYKICESLDQRMTQSEDNLEVNRLIDPLKADTHELTLIIGDVNKQFQGERKMLYWHRNSPLSPKIINCLLMTLEGWLYSRPTRSQLERSISIILNQSDTVAMLGVLITLAKCDLSLLSRPLLPLVSSLQLLIWLELEQIDRGQDFGFDTISAWKLSKAEQQELLAFNQLPHRKLDLQRIIFHLWINKFIPLESQSKIVKSWDSHQLTLVPEVSRSRASRIRAWFEHSNWQEKKDGEGKQVFQFIGTIPRDSEEEDKSKVALWNLQHLQIAVTCRQILDGEREKTLELHDQLMNLLTSKEQINFFKEKLEPQAFSNVIWAAITIVLEHPSNILSEKLKTELNYLTETFPNLSICLDHFHRCQLYNLDARAFIAHVAPRLLRELQPDSSIKLSAFRCLIGIRNCDTSAFMRSWLKEYGLENPLTQQLINVAPRIARLISLTCAFAYIKHIQKNANPDGSYILPRPEEIDYEISKREDSQIEEAWLSLQNDFVEETLQQEAIVDAFEWMPEVLIQPIQQMPSWTQERFIQDSFDWEFLTVALLPPLEARVEGEEIEEFINSLREQVIFAFLHERESVYAKYKADQEEGGYSHVHIHIHQVQSQLLDGVIKPNHMNVLVQVNKLLQALRNFKLIDCILLGHIIDNLSYNVADLDANNGSLRIQIAYAIGDYLFEFKNQSDSDLRILGKVSDAWEPLIKLLSRESRVAEDIVRVDQFLVQFFNRFHEVLFPHWWLRKELYRVAKSVEYKQFRRLIFKTHVQYQDLLPTSRNDESEALVQVLTELWDSDHDWVMAKLSRLQVLRTLLGQLQGIDAVGARSLADQVASFLANSSS
jgi:hypothetical protein